MSEVGSSSSGGKSRSDNSTKSPSGADAVPISGAVAADDLFSPTSNAAWALATLHNFGAPIRPTTESLTGTRLFNNPPDYVKSAPQNGASGSNSDRANAELGPSSTIPYTNATGVAHGVSWGKTNYHYPSEHIVDPSPVGITAAKQAQTAISAAKRKNVTTSTVTPTPKKLKTDITNVKQSTSTASYSRKKKSLGSLAENFIDRYRQKECGALIVVDQAALDLKVERRRIYDVVNILESISLVEKKHKNTYSWMGMRHLDNFFGSLQEKAICDYPGDAIKHLGIVDDNGKPLSLCQINAKPRTISESKSLAKLSQEFLQVFLVGFETLSLPQASDMIMGTASIDQLVAMGGGAPEANSKEAKAAASRGLKTKIRRLYDIANVFLSVGLLKKVENTSNDKSRRPNFSWSYHLNARDIYRLRQRKIAEGRQQQRPFHDSTYTENTGLVKNHF